MAIYIQGIEQDISIYGGVPTVIPVTMTVPEGVVAYPDIDAMVTTDAKKLSGFILPSAVDSTINWKLARSIPDVLPTNPVYTLRTTLKPQVAEASGTNVLLTQRYDAVADAETIDGDLVDEGQATVTMSTSIDVIDVYDQVLDAHAIAAGDYIIGQLYRNGLAGGDNLTQDVLVFNMCLIITGS